MSTETPNLAEMSDEDIMNMDVSRLQETPKIPASENSSGEGESNTSGVGEDNASGETGGAASDDNSSDETGKNLGSTSEEEDEDLGNGFETEGTAKQTTEGDQPPESGSGKPADASGTPQEPDYKAELGKVLAPFKAAKRTINVDSIDDARRLMQMGVDYARKMEAMKPYRRVLKTLEKANLIDEEEINFLIDLRKKDPAAIRKLLKDSEVDPHDLDLEDNSNYKPTDHMVADNEIALDDVIDELRGTPSFDRTVDIVTNHWDKASKKLLIDNPEVIRYLNQHVETGIYDQIANKVATERTFGRLSGMSDLEAYKTVGDAMYEKGELKPTSGTSSPPGNTSQASGHPKGSNPEDVKNRKRAASPTKGNASARVKVPNFAAMSDAEIEKFDINAL